MPIISFRRRRRSEFLDKLLEKSKQQLCDSNLAYVTEDPETGIRRRVTLSKSVIPESDAPPVTGLATDRAKSAVTVDIDTFTRPPEGHFDRAGMFFQESYIQSVNIATKVFRWLQEKQGK